MDDMTNAAVADSGEAEHDLNTTDGLADYFDSLDTDESDEPEKEPEQAPESEGTEPETSDPDPDQEQPETESVTVPEGWDEAVYRAMPPEARSAVEQREQAHAEAVRQHIASVQKAQAEQAEYEQRVANELQIALQAANLIVNAEFDGVNWLELQRTDPAQFLALDAERKQRMAAIQQLQAKAQAAEMYRQKKEAERNHVQLKAEFDAALPKVRKLVGEGFEGKAFRSELCEYMTSCGISPEVQGMLSKGYELEIITKAMLYDKQLTTAAAAAKKVAEAPVVHVNNKTNRDNGNERFSKARAVLKTNPNSTDALAAVFESM